MNIIKNLGLGIFTITCLLSLTMDLLAQKLGHFGGSTPSSFVVLNEIEINNPGAEVGSCNYIELRGDPVTIIPNDNYLVEIEGDDTSTGEFRTVINLNSVTFGTNGILTVSGTGGACGTRSYTSGGGGYFTDSNVSGLQQGAITFMIINSPTSVIVEGADYDTDNDGTLELPLDAIIIDSVGWIDGGTENFVYGGVDITPGNTSGAPDGATRNETNTTPLTATAWFADDIVGDSEDSVSYDQTNLTSPFVGGFIIDFQTPGNRNVAPSAAVANISGRVLNPSGRGLRFVTVIITGSSLPEPIYATTNMFGKYQFEDLSVGETYVLQVFSKHYTFKQPSIVFNLDDNITDANFIGFE